MKQVLLPIIGVAVFIIIAGLLVKKYNPKADSGFNNLVTDTRKEITISGKTIKVDVAKTEEQRKKGLSGKESLDSASGMLFVFEKQNIQPSFWMKDMRFAIDIVWINDGKIAQISEGAKPPEENTPEKDLKLYTPEIPIDFVLELASGFCKENSLKVGDSVDLTKIPLPN